MKKITILACLLVLVGVLAAQPSVTNIDPESTFAGGEVTISGEGFGTDISDINVWFGGVKTGNILSVTETSIVAEVPAGAVAGPIMIQRIASGLVGESEEDFFIRFYGTDITESDFDDLSQFMNGTVEFLDLCGCDFDGDKLTDFIVTHNSGTEISLLTNTSTIGNVSFSVTKIDIGAPSTSASCGDYDGDGMPDVSITRAGNNRNQVYFYRNTSTPGNIQFAALHSETLDNGSATTDPYQSVRIATEDMNKDGKLDLVVTNINPNGRLLNVLINKSTKGIIDFNDPILISTDEMNGSSGISTADLDNDGYTDLALNGSGRSDVYVYRNTGSSSISFEEPEILVTNPDPLQNSAIFDLDGDGKKEVITVSSLFEDVFIFKNNSTPGNLSFDAPIKVSLDNGGDDPEGWAVDAADVNGDGLLDIIASHRAEYKFSILINNGNLDFTSWQLPISQATRNVYAGDLDGDSKPDLAFTCLEIPVGNFSVQTVRNETCYTPEFYENLPTAICSGQSFVIGVPDNPGVTFSWKKDGSDLGVSDHELTVSSQGSYELTAISEGGTCNKSLTFVVADGTDSTPTPPIASNTSPGCEGQSVTLSVNEQTGATYFWTGPNGFTSTEREPVLNNLTQDMAGIYTVQVKIGVCQSSDAQTEVIIKGTESFSVTPAGATDICEGNSVTLSTQSRSGYTYVWYIDNTPTSETGTSINAISSGVYKVVVTDVSTGCEIESNTVPVNIFSAPIASFDVSTPICSGIETVFTSTSDVAADATVSYTWTFGDGTNSTGSEVQHSYATANNYDVTLVVSYNGVTGCNSTSSNTVSVVDAVPVSISASESVICNGESLQLTAEGDFSSLEWSTTETTPSIEITNPGSYSVTATDANGCVSSDDIAINEGDTPTINVIGTIEGENGVADAITVPAGTVIQLVASGADSYLWQPTEYLSATDIANPTSTPVQDISYTVTGAVIDGCRGTGILAITISGSSESIDIEPIAAFNPDNSNDPVWRILRAENYPENTVSIYDNRGTMVYRQSGYNNAEGWDGTADGKQLPEGVYYFVFSVNDQEPYTGTVLLVR